MAFRPEEVSSIIQTQLQKADISLEMESVGTILQVGDGIARIGDLAPGEYVVQTSAEGFTGTTTTVRVAAGELAAIEVTQKRSGTAPPIDNQLPRPPGISTPLNCIPSWIALFMIRAKSDIPWLATQS